LRYIFLIFLLLFSPILAKEKQTIDTKINKNENFLKLNSKQNKKTKLKIKKLALSIINEEKKFDNIEYKLNKVSNNIFLNSLKLSHAKKNIKTLQKKIVVLKKNISNVEVRIVDSIVKEYSLTLSKDQINKKSLKSIIEKEKYNLILDNAKDSILKSNLQYFKLSNDIRKNEKKKLEIEKYIQEQENKKILYKKLKEKQFIALERLNYTHRIYQKRLKSIINKQHKISGLLDKLNIVKKKNIKKEKLAKLAKKREIARLKKKKEKEKKIALAKLKRETKNIKMKSKSKKKTIVKESKEIRFSSKKTFKDDIDLTVRNIGSTTKGVKISKYKGKKTISPLRRYTITKKFGKFYDDVYKIELFNESISMKSKTKNAKVYSVLKGKVVYAKHDAGELGNVVIVKHKNNLHTIYSQLSNIPKTLKIGQWIKKGYVVGRVKNILVFQATRNNRYLNPQKLFKK